MKNKYVRPCFVKVVAVRLERNLLESANNSTVQNMMTSGQEVDAFDYTSEASSQVKFNHVWGNE